MSDQPCYINASIYVVLSCRSVGPLLYCIELWYDDFKRLYTVFNDFTSLRHYTMLYMSSASVSLVLYAVECNRLNKTKPDKIQSEICTSKKKSKAAFLPAQCYPPVAKYDSCCGIKQAAQKV
ncbi:hypothetical protein BDZ97DRAFT_1776868 [Flammula alnicola]|nr:hypothetical protein BDZ97DRAFT_1776868 [Flammula alnicola]